MHLLPTIHPAAALRGRPLNDTIAADLGKAKRISETGINLKENYTIIVPGNPSGLQPAFDSAMAWMKHWRTNGADLGVDVETSGLEYFNCRLYSISLAEAEPSNTAIAFTLRDLHTLPWQMEQALEAELAKVLASDLVNKVYHNSPFDRAVLARKGFKIGGRTLDTMAMHHLMQPDIPHDLGWVGHTFLDVPPWKLTHDSNKMANTTNPAELLLYNAKDALFTAQIIEPLQRTLTQRGISQNLISWQMAFADLATDMELSGIPINHTKRRYMGMLMLRRMFLQEKRIKAYLSWNDFNPMSQLHRQEVLFGEKYAAAPWGLGLVPTRFTPKENLPSTSYKAIIDHMEHPLVSAMVDYIETRHTYATQYKEGPDAEIKKLKELSMDDHVATWEDWVPCGLEVQYGDMAKQIERNPGKPGSYTKSMCDDSRAHPKWNPVAQRGSRFSSSPNFQNQKSWHRGFIEPTGSRVIIASDKSQLEARLVAVRAGIIPLLEEMRRGGGDVHTMNAALVYGQEFWQKDKLTQKNIRAVNKNVFYAGIYLAGWETVWRTCRENKKIDPELRAAMTKKTIRFVHASLFKNLYGGISRWHEANLKDLRRTGCMTIPPFNRKRYCPIFPPPATEFANWAIQCYTEGMEIYTVKGIIPITGASVSPSYLPNGDTAPCSLVPRGTTGELTTLSFGTGEHAVQTTPEHEWVIQTGEGYRYAKSQDLKKGSLICIPLPAAPSHLQQGVRHRSFLYWLGAFISDGSTARYCRDLYFGTSKNNRDPRLAWKFWMFAGRSGWSPIKPRDMGPKLKHVRCGETLHGRQKFREDMTSWGYNLDWIDHTKRVPVAAKQNGVWGARQFIWGMLEADGSQTSGVGAHGNRSSIYNFHMCNLPLLQDMLNLCRYAGIEGKINGPYKPDQGTGGDSISWRLDLHPYDVENVIFRERGNARSRLRIDRMNLVPPETVELFLKDIPTNIYQRQSSYATLHHRLQNGGTTSPWTLREMYRAADAPVQQALYATIPVQQKRTAKAEKTEVYTLSVHHPTHLYLAQGMVTKNCVGSDYVTMEMVQIQHAIRERFGPSAYIFRHGHDELNIECNAGDAEEIVKIVNHFFDGTKIDGPAGPVLLTADTAIAKNLRDAH